MSIDLNFEPIFIAQSSFVLSQTHKVFKTADNRYINVVDINQASHVERIVIGTCDTLTEALDAMFEQFKIDEQTTIENIEAEYKLKV